jgi:hypothetical protein
MNFTDDGTVDAPHTAGEDLGSARYMILKELTKASGYGIWIINKYFKNK